jgi:hypothetical protein
MALRTRLLTGLLLAVGCAADGPPQVTLTMVARDGEDPLEGAARLRIELVADPPREVEPVAVDAAGFDVELDLPGVESLRRVRLVLEDEDGAVVSRGATPEAPLDLLSGVPLHVLVSRPGVAGSVTLDGWPALAAAAPLEGEWVVGLDAAGTFGMLDLLALAPVAGVAPLQPPRPDARLADLGEGRTLAVGGGEGVRVYDGRTNLFGDGGDGIDEGSFVAPVVLALAEGGAVAACGGRREIVAFGADGAVSWTAELAAPRTGCAAAIAVGALIVYGGGDDEAPAAEVVDLADHAVRTLVAEPDPRRDAAAAAAGTRVLVLGGARDDEALADGLRLDPACADGCPAPIDLGGPRAPAVAWGLDDDRVLLAGGGEPPEIVAAEGMAAAPVPGPSSDASVLLRAGTDDVWWWGPDGAGVYAE